METVIKTEGLSKVYKSTFGGRHVHALQGLDLDIKRGETYGLVGPNGSGKTTTIKILVGLIYSSSGSATLFGSSLSDPAVKQRIGFMPEGTYFYDWLTGEEILRFYGAIHGLTGKARDEKVDELLTLVGMQERRHMLLRHYSRGMLQRIGLAQALIGDPELLILDEPTSGVDPVGSYEIRDLMQALKSQGKTILISSHLLNQVEEICDRVGILYRGRMIVEGAIDELLPPGPEKVVRERMTLEELFIQKVRSAHMEAE